MPISNKYKFKFIHIPKTGGSSIEVIFDLQHKENLFVPAITNTIEGVDFSPQHFPHSLINYFKPEVKDWFSFTIVRNPYTRIISEYFYIKKNFEASPVINFNENEFLTWLDTSWFMQNRDHKLHQITFIDEPVDMIIKFENFEQDFDKLKKKLHLPNEINLINDNKSVYNKLEIAQSLSKKAKDKIYKIFEQDFKTFDYESSI